MSGDSRLRFGVLGAFRVERDGREVDPGPRLQRALLAILVVDAGHVVAVNRLIDLLWREEPPAAAIASLQAYISRLRRVLEPGRPPRAPARVLVTQDPGYVLRVADDQVDLLAADTGEWHRAAVRHGVAQAVLDRTGLPWEELEARYRNESLGQVRAHLGQEQFEQAHAMGMALSPDEALDLASGKALPAACRNGA